MRERKVGKIGGPAIAMLLVFGMVTAGMPVAEAEKVPLVFTGTCKMGAYTVALIPNGDGYVVRGVVVKPVSDILTGGLPSYGDNYVNIVLPPSTTNMYNFNISMNGQTVIGVGIGTGQGYIHIHIEDGVPLDVNQTFTGVTEVRIYGLTATPPLTRILEYLISEEIEIFADGTNEPLESWVLFIEK